MSSTNRGSVRNLRDFYATPEHAYVCLDPVLPRDVTFYEPACGDGRIVKWLRETGRRAEGADIEPQWHGAKAIDFLNSPAPLDVQFVITNPPFSLALPFCSMAIANYPEVMMLLRLNFLGAQKRRGWWQNNEPAALFVLSERPDFTGDGGDSCEYAWFYWGSRMKGIHHL